MWGKVLCVKKIESLNYSGHLISFSLLLLVGCPLSSCFRGNLDLTFRDGELLFARKNQDYSSAPFKACSKGLLFRQIEIYSTDSGSYIQSLFRILNATSGRNIEMLLLKCLIMEDSEVEKRRVLCRECV